LSNEDQNPLPCPDIVSDSVPKSIETDAAASENVDKRKWEQLDGEKIGDTKK